MTFKNKKTQEIKKVENNILIDAYKHNSNWELVQEEKNKNKSSEKQNEDEKEKK